MNAFVLAGTTGPDRLQATTLPTPTIGATEVLVQVKAISLNPIDVKVSHGQGLCSLLKRAAAHDSRLGYFGHRDGNRGRGNAVPARRRGIRKDEFSRPRPRLRRVRGRAGLPPALIRVVENDVLRDEGEAYGRKLSEAGVPATTIRYNGVAEVPAAAATRAQVLQQPTGLLKAVVEEGSGRILGCTLFCAEASEVVDTVQPAMKAELPYSVLRDNIYIHPSMTEALNDLFGKL